MPSTALALVKQVPYWWLVALFVRDRVIDALWSAITLWWWVLKLGWLILRNLCTALANYPYRATIPDLSLTLPDLLVVCVIWATVLITLWFLHDVYLMKHGGERLRKRFRPVEEVAFTRMGEVHQLVRYLYARPWTIYADQEVVHDCDTCRAVACQFMPPEVMEILYGHLKTKESFFTSPPHECPFKDGSTAPPLLVAKLILLGQDLLEHKAVEKIPEGKGVAKSWKVKDRKHYVRGGKFRSGRTLISDEDYDRLVEKLEMGQFNRAVDEYLQTQMDEAEDCHNTRYASQARDRAARHLYNLGERMGLNTREYFEATKHMRIPEAGGVGVPRFALHEQWTIPATSDVLARYKHEAAHSQELHAARTVEARKKAVAEKATRVPAATDEVVPETQNLGAISRKARKRNKRRAAKRAAAVVDVATSSNQAPEGAVMSSLAFNRDAVVAALELEGSRVMQGYLAKKASGYTWFITGRHAIVDGKVVDGIAPLIPGSAVKLHRPGRPPLETVCVERRGTGDDRVALRLANVPDVQAARCRQAKKGGVVSARYFDLNTGVWYDVVGTVQLVSPVAVAYDMSTKSGCCRMPIFDQQGYVVAGHYYPYVDTPAGRFPGGQTEDGEIPAKWEARYSPPPITPQGLRVGETAFRAPFARIEDLKVCGLRADTDMTWYQADFHMAKPSTQMLHEELAKFFEPISITLDQRLLKVAVSAAMKLDAEGSHPAPRAPRISDFVAMLRTMDNERTNAGSDMFGGSHRDYILEMGDGDLELGILRLAEKAHHLYQCIIGAEEATDDDRDELFLMTCWCVQGKRDGYKYRKLYKGRSVQAPNLTFKLIYRTILADSDAFWISRKWMFRVGYDMDKPVDPELASIYKATLASLGLDQTGFDRRMMEEFMRMYFLVYLPYSCPGVHPTYCQFLADATIDSYLVLTDGTVYQKHRGNPSGFPNTLRLNCVVQLFAWCYAMAVRLEQLTGNEVSDNDVVETFERDVFLEICGDDSRANVLTERGLALLDVQGDFDEWLTIWRERLPWEVKIEGKAVFAYTLDAAGNVVFELPDEDRMFLFPPLVARNLVVFDGYLWSPLHNPLRCIRKLMSQGTDPAFAPLGRSEADEDVLRLSAVHTLKLHLWWHEHQYIFCPAIQVMLDNGMVTPELRRQAYTAFSACWGHAIWQCVPLAMV